MYVTLYNNNSKDLKWLKSITIYLKFLSENYITITQYLDL